MAKHKICIDLGTANTLIWTDAGKLLLLMNLPLSLLINKKRSSRNRLFSP